LFWYKEAPENALKIIQQRSNSLMPYVLQEIVSTKEKVDNGLKIFDLLLKIKWEESSIAQDKCLQVGAGMRSMRFENHDLGDCCAPWRLCCR